MRTYHEVKSAKMSTNHQWYSAMECVLLRAELCTAMEGRPILCHGLDAGAQQGVGARLFLTNGHIHDWPFSSKYWYANNE